MTIQTFSFLVALFPFSVCSPGKRSLFKAPPNRLARSELELTPEERERSLYKICHPLKNQCFSQACLGLPPTPTPPSLLLLLKSVIVETKLGSGPGFRIVRMHNKSQKVLGPQPVVGYSLYSLLCFLSTPLQLEIEARLRLKPPTGQWLQAGICRRRAVRGSNCRQVSVEGGQSEAVTAGRYLWNCGMRAV